MSSSLPSWSYDPEADMGYLTLREVDRDGVERSIPVGDLFVVDVDTDGLPVGVEVYGNIGSEER